MTVEEFYGSLVGHLSPFDYSLSHFILHWIENDDPMSIIYEDAYHFEIYKGDGGQPHVEVKYRSKDSGTGWGRWQRIPYGDHPIQLLNRIYQQAVLTEESQV